MDDLRKRLPRICAEGISEELAIALMLIFRLSLPTSNQNKPAEANVNSSLGQSSNEKSA
jgi:hypothetical protein